MAECWIVGRNPLNTTARLCEGEHMHLLGTAALSATRLFVERNEYNGIALMRCRSLLQAQRS